VLGRPLPGEDALGQRIGAAAGATHLAAGVHYATSIKREVAGAASPSSARPNVAGSQGLSCRNAKAR
jgi:hypothetical protein